MTVAEAFEQYLRECGEDALPAGADRLVAEKAFYCGVVRGVEMVSVENKTLESVRTACLALTLEVVEWMDKKLGRGFLN